MSVTSLHMFSGYSPVPNKVGGSNNLGALENIGKIFSIFFKISLERGVNMSKIVYLDELCINQHLKHFIAKLFARAREASSRDSAALFVVRSLHFIAVYFHTTRSRKKKTFSVPN